MATENALRAVIAMVFPVVVTNVEGHTAEPMGDVDTYFVCATPRTGSSLLLGLLDSTGVAGHPQAYFREPDELSWADRWQIPRTSAGVVDYTDFVRAARAAGTTENGVFGAKLMWGTLDSVITKLRTATADVGDDVTVLSRAFGRIRFVFVRRDDVLAQAVSWLRAEQTATWFLGGAGEISGAPGNSREPSFDPDRITSLTQTINEHNAGWENWFASAGIQPHRVRYEELNADLVGVTLDVLTFLGLDLPMGRTIQPRHQRQADELNAQWIDRYRTKTDPAHGSNT